MKLLVIWLLGVPLVVAAMCTVAALWPRESGSLHAEARRSEGGSAIHRNLDLEPVLPSVAP